MIARFPADRVTVIVLSNNESVFAGQIARDLAAIMFGAAYKIPQEFKTVAVDPKILQLYVGEYQAGVGYTWTVTFENGKMMSQRNGFPKRELFAESETRFNRNDKSAFYIFERDADGRVTKLVFYGNEVVIPAQKIK